MTNFDKENEKSLENSLNKAISDMDFSNISNKVKESLDGDCGRGALYQGP